MSSTKSGRLVQWGPIEAGQSKTFTFYSHEPSKEQIQVKSGKVADYVCFPIILAGSDTVGMLPFNGNYDSQIIQDIVRLKPTPQQVCTLYKDAYTKKDGTSGAKLRLEISGESSAPFLEEPQSTESDLIAKVDAVFGTDNKPQPVAPQKDGMTMGMCFKISCGFHLENGDVNDMEEVKKLTNLLYKTFQELMSE